MHLLWVYCLCRREHIPELGRTIILILQILLFLLSRLVRDAAVALPVHAGILDNLDLTVGTATVLAQLPMPPLRTLQRLRPLKRTLET